MSMTGVEFLVVDGAGCDWGGNDWEVSGSFLKGVKKVAQSCL